MTKTQSAHGKNIWSSQSSIIFLYLLAVVMANLSSAHFGPSASIINAFLFIGLDLSSRDRLHDAWTGRGFAFKMGALIAAGSLLSWLINRNAGSVALASFVAFGASAVADTVVYQLLHGRHTLVRVNGSNVFGALADSLIFPTLAFGGFLPAIVFGQFAAKVLGGALWSIFLDTLKPNTISTKYSTPKEF